MTREEAIKALRYERKTALHENKSAFDMAIQALEQIACFTNARGEVIVCDEFKDMLCDECRNKRTSFCGNCKEYDEFEQEPTFDDECQKDMDEAWEQIQKKRKRIPVTLDLTPCDDAISREAVKELIKCGVRTDTYDDVEQVCKWIDALPTVTQKSDEQLYKNGFADGYEQGYKDAEQKSGHWILDETDNSITCNKCGCLIWANDISNGDAHYCPNCGAKMDEPQESEDKE